MRIARSFATKSVVLLAIVGAAQLNGNPHSTMHMPRDIPRHSMVQGVSVPESAPIAPRYKHLRVKNRFGFYVDVYKREK